MSTEAELPNPRGSSGVPQGGQVPGQVPGQDPALSHPHLVTRPVFYIHAPPPPPFMHYQWPVPFFSPFSPFSGLGYSMMPPFPPAPYMEPPAYFLPHAPVQPMDYRRMAHPQQPHPSGAPYLSQARRPRPPPPGLVRETVSFGVQTEAREEEYHVRGSPLRSCSDSGKGTAPNSPTSSTSSNRKNSENCSRAKDESELRMSNPGEGQSVQTMDSEKRLVSSPSLKSRNLHLVRQENVETVDSPKDKGKSNKERRVSVPDILMNWGNGFSQEETTAKDKGVKVSLREDEVVNFQSSTVLNEELLDVETVDDDDGDKGENEPNVDPKMCFEAREHSLNVPVKLCSVGPDAANEQTLQEQSENVTQSENLRRKLNDSIWSVESLPVFIPTKEWMAQNMTAGPEVIVEMAEEVDKGAPGDQRVNQKSHRNSSTDSMQMSESLIGFSTPASKETAKQANSPANESAVYTFQKHTNSLDLPICDKSKLLDTVGDTEINEAPERISPKRLSFTEQEKPSGDLEKERTILLEPEKGSEEESSQKKCPEGEVERLAVPVLAVTEVSPSKVDCGVQFPELQMNKGNAQTYHEQFYSLADLHNVSARSVGYYGNGQKRRFFRYRSKCPEKTHSQQDSFYHNFDRPGKSRGGKGRY